MAGNLDQLYQHIVQAFALKDELIDIDLNANASESGGDLSEAKQEALDREQTVAGQLEPYFRSGIAKAQAGKNRPRPNKPETPKKPRRDPPPL